jgi:hypothetical protein
LPANKNYIFGWVSKKGFKKGLWELFLKYDNLRLNPAKSRKNSLPFFFYFFRSHLLFLSIFSCHPHGLLSVGPFINFCTNGSGFNTKFPGIHSYPATLTGQFYFPFRREIIIALGVVAASARGICSILKREGGGNAVCLVVGGAEEALDSHEGNYSLCINKRKGFVRLALQNGASLVPGKWWKL